MILSLHLESNGIEVAQIPTASGPFDLTIGYPAGTVVPYQVVSQTGYEPPTVFLDDTLRSASGMITMSTSHNINAATDSLLSQRPGIDLLRARLQALVDAPNKPNAYAAYLTWSLDSALTVFGTDEALSEAITIASYFQFDPVTNFSALAALDDALAGYAFEIRGSGNQHSVTVLSPPNYGGQILGNKIKTQRASSSTILADSVVFIFVNGIRSVERDAFNSGRRLVKLLGDGTFPKGQATYMWNSNLRGALLQYADATLGCAGRALRDATVRQQLTIIARYAACRSIDAVAALLWDDVKNSVTGFVSSQWGASAPTDADAIRLAHLISRYHGGHKHAVVVPHSQANLLFSQAAPLVPNYDGVPLQNGACTAAASLASPIEREHFNIAQGLLVGMTINRDILLVMGLPNNFTRMTTARTDSATRELATITKAGQYLLAEKKWGWKIHGVDENYLAGAEVTDLLTSGLQYLYDTCRSLPPS